jgi:amino acid permease
MASWSLICATYLRFRVAARRQPGVEDAIPDAAKSPLQPYLAIYGFACSTILRNSPYTHRAELIDSHSPGIPILRQDERRLGVCC